MTEHDVVIGGGTAGAVRAARLSENAARSTAPMGGPADEWAVVGAVGAVNGLPGLRVVDALIVPGIPSTPTNLTVIVLAEHIHERAYAGVIHNGQ